MQRFVFVAKGTNNTAGVRFVAKTHMLLTSALCNVFIAVIELGFLRTRLIEGLLYGRTIG